MSNVPEKKIAIHSEIVSKTPARNEDRMTIHPREVLLDNSTPSFSASLIFVSSRIPNAEECEPKTGLNMNIVHQRNAN